MLGSRPNKSSDDKICLTISTAFPCGTHILNFFSSGPIGPGDEVISTPYTMVATNTGILEQFANPVFADIKYEKFNIDPDNIERRINEKTKAIMCVHWGGYPCDIDEIHKIASNHNLPVIEDAAHALGASYKNKPIGVISDYTVFSFQAIKHLTTVDGGMLSIKNNNKYQEALRRRWFGIYTGKRCLFVTFVKGAYRCPFRLLRLFPLLKFTYFSKMNLYFLLI